MNYINDKIKIDFPVPYDIQDMMEQCEKHDKDDNYGAYEAKASFLTGTLCKNAYVHHNITKKEWERIEQRYVLW